MRKLLALFKNETLKTVKRVAILVAVIIMIVAIGGCAGIGKAVDFFSSNYDWTVSYKEMAENYKSSLEYYEEELPKIRETAAESGDNKELLFYLTQIAMSEVLYKVYSVAGEYMTDGEDYRAQIVNDLVDEVNDVFNGTSFETEEQIETFRVKYLAKAEDLGTLLKCGDMSAYIESYKKSVLGGYYPESVKAAYEEADGWIMAQKDDIAPEAVTSVLREAMNYALLKGSVKDGLNYQNSYSSGQELTEFGLREFEEKVETLEFKLKNGYSAEASRNESSGVAQKRNVLSQLTKVGLVFALVIVVMWAGSAISVEMNNGSIKSLIIAPVRRGKIFAAKFMTLVELVLAVTLVNYLVSYFFTILMYGFKYTGTLVYVDALGPHAMPFWLALLLELLIDGIAILLFGALAMCLSALTKNTAVSVAVPMGIFLGGLIVDLILSEVMSDKPFVLAMMPIQNLGNLHFTNGQISSIFKLIGESQAYPMGRLFSYAYVLILISAFTWCAADSFCRKDIT